MKLTSSTIVLFIAAAIAVSVDTGVSPELAIPGRRGVDCGACERLGFCPGNTECELDGCCSKK
jgi:hypothetical protein